MSFVRFGQEGSGVYLYQDVAGHVACCGCALLPDDDFHTRDLVDMLNHVRVHRMAGHLVPWWLEIELRRDWPYPDGVS